MTVVPIPSALDLSDMEDSLHEALGQWAANVSGKRMYLFNTYLIPEHVFQALGANRPKVYKVFEP